MEEYIFKTDDAIKYGVDEAIFLYNIRFWVKKNKLNNKNFKDGKYWTYNTLEAYLGLYQFWTEKQLRRIIKNLKDSNAILIGRYSEKKWDRTNWYTTNDEILSEKPAPKRANGSAQKGSCIRNTDVNTDKNIKDSEESGKKPENFYSEEFDRFIEYWNKKEYLPTHKNKSSQLWKRARKFFALLTKGNITKSYFYDKKIEIIFDKKYFKDFNIDLSLTKRPLSDEEIYLAIDRHNLKASSEYNPPYVDNFPKGVDVFIFNPKTKTSFFFAALSNEPTLICPDIKDAKVHKIYRDQVFQSKRLNDAEQVELVKAANFVVKRQKEWYNRVGQYISYSRLKNLGFYKTHIEFLRERYMDAGFMDTSKILNQNIWRKYLVWLKAKHKIDLEPGESQCLVIKAAYEKKQEEAADERRKERRRISSRGVDRI